MKAAIVFYSFSGNTKKASRFLKSEMESKGIVTEEIELCPELKEFSFFKQGMQAFLKKMPELKEVNYDLSKFDFIIFASCVWALNFAPALRSYLSKAGGLENKKTGCFLTYGTGVGKGRALSSLEDTLREKSANILFSETLKGKNSADIDYLKERFKPLLEIII